MSLPEGVVLRGVVPADKPFIAKSWFSSFLKHADVRYDIYKVGQNRRIERVLGDPNTRIAVAVHSELPDEILGFAVWGTALHFVYVKQPYRRRGLATALAGASRLTEYTHRTPAGEKLAAKLGGSYNPYAA